LVDKIRSKVKDRKIRDFWSDEDDSWEEEVPLERKFDIEQFELAKAERTQAKISIDKFVRKFREDNDGKNPKDDDTIFIAEEWAHYNVTQEKYLEVKLALIKNKSLPFDAEKFSRQLNLGANLPDLIRKQTVMSQM